MRQRVAIVLVNYKDYASSYLFECYESLQKQNYKDFDVYIADNQGNAETKCTIRKLAPSAKIITNSNNLGWAGGNNSVISRNLGKYDYYVLLNMDTVLDPTWLDELIRARDKNNLDIVQSKILIYGENVINSLGNRINYLGYGYCTGYGKNKNLTLKEAGGHMDYASGASMLVTREVFERIGLFREEYFMYHDDLEFCWRARLAGFKLGLAEKSVCHHKYSFGGTMSLIYYMERNRLVTMFGLMRWPTIVLILPMLLPFELMMLVYLGSQGKFTEKANSLVYLFSKSGRSLIHKIRQETKIDRTLKDKDVVRGFSGKVEFAEIDNWLLNKVANPILGLYWSAIKILIIW